MAPNSRSELMAKLSGSALREEPRCSAHRSSRSRSVSGDVVRLEPATPRHPGTSLLSWRGAEGWADGARDCTRLHEIARVSYDMIAVRMNRKEMEPSVGSAAPSLPLVLRIHQHSCSVGSSDVGRVFVL